MVVNRANRQVQVSRCRATLHACFMQSRRDRETEGEGGRERENHKYSHSRLLALLNNQTHVLLPFFPVLAAVTHAALPLHLKNRLPTRTSILVRHLLPFRAPLPLHRFCRRLSDYNRFVLAFADVAGQMGRRRCSLGLEPRSTVIARWMNRESSSHPRHQVAMTPRH